MQKNRFAYTLALVLAVPSCLLASSYVQTNLVSNLTTVGAVPPADANVINPWGMSFGPTTPFWLANNGTSTSTLYSGAGAPVSAIKVTVPGGPTGTVFNSAPGSFPVNTTGGGSALFLFDTLSGNIDAWNGSLGVMGTAATVKTTAGAVYTGLAITPAGSSTPLVYAANFTNGGGINVFDGSFTQLNGTSFAGKFIDPKVPAGYAPFNIQLVGNNLYVEYAEVGSTPGNANRGAGLGFVGVFNLNGDFLNNISSPMFDAPWGVTMAPGNFGQFSNDLLVGNFGNGEINAFDSSGNWAGTLMDGNNPIVNQDLWALNFRPDGGGGSVSNGLYFDAGIGREADGLFGFIAPAPEPSVYGSAGLGLTLIGGFAFFKRRNVH
jgi:uncharacterized protein (TIGR03118 family)